MNESGNKMGNGFQIFNTNRVGHHIKLFKDRFFIKPSVAVKHRPYQATMPDGFKQLDDKGSKSIFGGRGFHFGFNF